MNPLYYTPEPDSWYDFDQLFFALDNATIAKISHQPADFIRNCTLEGKSTRQCNIFREKGGNQRYLGTTFGLCYTYNINHNGRSLDMATRSGEHAGLELILDMEGDYSMRNTLTQWSGASVTLFANNKAPDIYGKSILVHPGTWTKIGITKEEHIKDFRKRNYTLRCTDTWQKQFPFSFQPYSPPLCAEAIKQKAIMEHCNCMMSNKMLNGLVEMNPQVSSMGRWCNNGNDEDCKDSIFEGLANGTILPFMECKPLCREQLFKVPTTFFLLYIFFNFNCLK